MPSTPTRLDGVLPRPSGDPALDQISEWERQLDEIGEPLPAVELGLRWLRANAPGPAEPRLVHGDFRLGNFIVDRGRPRGGDRLGARPPRRSGRGHRLALHPLLAIRQRRPPGCRASGELDEFVSAYEAAGGEAIDRERVRYWEAFGNVKWAVICARQAHDHLTGVRRSHELASLGRRVCEPEWDLLQLVRS